MLLNKIFKQKTYNPYLWSEYKLAKKYNSLFEDAGFFSSAYFQVLVKTLLKEIKHRITPNQSLLDTGCGNGYLTREIKKFTKNVSGCDFSQELINYAKSKDKSIHYWTQNLEIPNSNSRSAKFNLVISNLVLIYIKNIDVAIHNLANYLKTGGFLFVSIPHPCFNQEKNQNWFSNQDNLPLEIEDYLTEKMFFKKIGNKVNTHHFHRKIETYSRIFRKNGLTIIEMLEPKPTQVSNEILKKASKLPFFLIFILKKSKSN